MVTHFKPLSTTDLACCLLLQLNSLLRCKPNAVQNVNFTLIIVIHIDSRGERVTGDVSVAHFTLLVIRTVAVCKGLAQLVPIHTVDCICNNNPACPTMEAGPVYKSIGICIQCVVYCIVVQTFFLLTTRTTEFQQNPNSLYTKQETCMQSQG